MKYSLLIVVSILLTSCQMTGPQKHDVLISKIDSILDTNSFNGVILLTRDSTTLFSASIGYSDLEKKTPINANDQFVIGSISKQISAVLVLREYEKGNIGLDDKINTFLTEINQPWAKEINIHQLLTHTHGIVDINKPLEFAAGSQFHYSQLGYELLANILEKVTSKTFEELSTEFFRQYGLNHTFHPNNSNNKNLVKGYVEDESGLLRFTPNSLRNYVPAGCFISNAEDLNTWNQLLFSGKLVKMETLKLMQTEYATRKHPIYGTIGYGYGLLFNDGEQHLQIGALGYAPGFVSACYHYPQTNMNLIILENTANNIDDFRKTFEAHTEIMKLIKDECSTTSK